MTAPVLEHDDAFVYHGDCLDLLSTVRQNPGRADLVVTDPPYVIGAVSTGSEASKSGTWHDMMNSAHWFATWYRTIRNDVLKPDGAMWTFLNWRSLPVVQRAAADAGWKIESLLVWDKDWIGPGGNIGLRPRYELVALLPGPEFVVPDRGIPDMVKFRWGPNKPSGHPAEKPEPLLRWIIETSGKRGGLVVDPFMGSGSTLVAARDLGCPTVGIEQHVPWITKAGERLASAPLFTA